MTALLAVAFLLVGGAKAAPPPSVTPEVAAALAEARALLNQGKPREALGKLDLLDSTHAMLLVESSGNLNLEAVALP